MDICERIKAKRNELGLTQEELANKVGVSFQAISKWENGKSLPDIEILPVLSTVLNESIDFLLTGKEFSKNEMHHKREAVEYFESFIKPYTLTESGVRRLNQIAEGYPIDRVKECIRIAADTYGKNSGEIQKSQVSEMLKKLGGILYYDSLPSPQRRIAQLVASLSKRLCDNDKQASGQLKKDIANLLSWKLLASDRKGQENAILNEINETHLSGARSLWSAHYSIEEEIERHYRIYERDQRMKKFTARVRDGYLKIDKECPVLVREQVETLNEDVKTGAVGLVTNMEMVVSALVLEMLAQLEFQDEFLIENIQKGNYRALAPKMYDYLGSYLGKSEHESLLQMINSIDALAAGDSKNRFAILDELQDMLNRLLRKWLILRNRKERRKHEKPS